MDDAEPNVQEELRRLARRNHPRSQNLYNIRYGTSAKVLCYICDEIIDTFSGKWAMPKHTQKAIAGHLAQHQQEIINQKSLRDEIELLVSIDFERN